MDWIQLAKDGGKTLNICKHGDEYSGYNNFQICYILVEFFIIYSEASQPARSVHGCLLLLSACLLAHAPCSLRYVCYYTCNLMHRI